MLTVQTLLFESCSTSYKSSVNTFNNKININLSKHNLTYQFVHDSLFEKPVNKQIDTFDYLFLSQLYRKIKSRGFQLGQDSSFQIMNLENCLIDFSYGQSKLVKFTHDSFYVNQFTSTLVCQTNIGSTKLFTATYDEYQDYKIKPKSNAKNSLDPTKKWLETNNYYYCLEPISYNKAYLIARNLSERAAFKLDSINEVNFIKNYPELADKSIKEKKINPVVDFLQVLGVVTLLLVFNIL